MTVSSTGVLTVTASQLIDLRNACLAVADALLPIIALDVIDAGASITPLQNVVVANVNATTGLVSGTISAGLLAGELVHVWRGTTDLGIASVAGTNWTFADTGLVAGQTYVYTAKVVNSNGLAGPTSAAYLITITTPPVVAPATYVTITGPVNATS